MKQANQSGAGVPPAIRKTRRRLPHWYREGATYFITFRLADSLPAHVLDQWKEDQRIWLLKYPEPHTPAQAEQFREIFSEKKQAYLDAGHGKCILAQTPMAEIVRNALLHFNDQRYALGDYVIMPNHVHCLVTPNEGHDLSKILHSWKSFTSHEIGKQSVLKSIVWQDESFDHIVRNEEELDKYRTYIADNPVKAHLTKSQFCYGRMERSVIPLP